LAKGLAERNIYVDVYHLSIDSSTAYSDYFSSEELKYISFYELDFPTSTKFPGHYIFNNYLHSKNLYRQIGNKKYDLIYAQGFTSWYFLKKNNFDDRIISNLHGLEMFQNPINWKNAISSRLLRIPAKKIIKKSKAQISLGGKLTDILIENSASKNSIYKIPNGIDKSWIIDRKSLEKHSSELVQFTFVGRNERRKGIIEIEEALNSLLEENVNFNFNFVGINESDLKIRSYKIKFYGLIRNEEEIKNILDKTDVLVCPSYSEGMPTVILEAMSRGCAIMATDVGAVSELVDEYNGRLIQGDIISGLQEGFRNFLRCDKDQLHSMKQKSIQKVKKDYTWDKVIDDMLEKIKNQIL
jgi:glycosyltransferase involved in cell wall biosynthesis